MFRSGRRRPANTGRVWGNGEPRHFAAVLGHTVAVSAVGEAAPKPFEVRISGGEVKDGNGREVGQVKPRHFAGRDKSRHKVAVSAVSEAARKPVEVRIGGSEINLAYNQ